jgi:hypothetical protein
VAGDSSLPTTTPTTLVGPGVPAGGLSSIPGTSKPITAGAKPSLADSHPDREKWPEWMLNAVQTFEKFTKHDRWVDLLDLWIAFEDLLGYPHGQVSFISFDQDHVYLLTLIHFRPSLCSSTRLHILKRSTSGSRTAESSVPCLMSLTL